MQNLFLYEEFNWFRKPKELDKEITEIINDIKLNFNINNLSYVQNDNYIDDNNFTYFNYTYKGQSLKVGYTADYMGPDIGTFYLWTIYLNEEYIRPNVSKKIIKSFFKFLKNKWNERNKQERKDTALEQKNKLRRLKDTEGIIGNEEIDPFGEENWL